MAAENVKPDYAIFLDGTKLDPEAMASVAAIRVFQTRNGASAFEIVVSDPQLIWQGKATFADAKEVKIQLGQTGKLKTVFEGDATAWRTELLRDGPTVFVIRGLDKSHLLMRGTKTRTYTDQTPLSLAWIRYILTGSGPLPALVCADNPASCAIFLATSSGVWST